ncbi:efflux transporter outer membrane subunit [Caldimonas sp. KR1-144]|uniref:efflux transporter outer membrane subunit n=1 Tax=Caldimonas sp. KR1-144 TaxID=3400911 RepID=UPI003C091DB4
MNTPSHLRHALMLACATVLAGCAAPPDREARPQAMAVERLASADSLAAAPAARWPADAWWRAYGDAQLDALIAEALADAPTLAAARARLHKAQAAADRGVAERRPRLDANASITAQQQSENHLSPPSATPNGWHDYGRATLDFSWDLDLWGQRRAALAAAVSEAAAAEADLAQSRLLLSTAIAASYAELARAYAALDTAKAAFEVRAKTATLFAERQRNGLETLGSVRQVESRRASAAADVLAIEEQIVLQRHRLAALMGAGPDRGLSIERPAEQALRPLGLPAQLPAQLIGRRPDLVAARLRAEASAKRIDEAQAAFYPNVNLLAFVGVQSLGLDMLARGASAIGSVGPAVSLPIFDGGRLRSRLRGADADHALAVAEYDRTLVRALQDVADAAASQRALGAQLERSDEAVNLAREAWQVQNRRYEGGLATYLEVLSAEDSLLATLRSQADLRSRAFSLDVALVRALGGGYSAPSL